MSIVAKSTAETASSNGVTITSDASTNTKGGYTELITSTPEETYLVQLVIRGPITASDVGFIVYLATGAATSEVDVIAIPFFANAGGLVDVTFPRTFSASTRMSICCQDSVGGNSVEVMLYLSNDTAYGTSTVHETMGLQTGTSQGTDIDPGSVNNTKGSYTELVASTANEYQYWLVFIGNSTNSAQTNQAYLVDVLATGIATSEVDKIANVPFNSTALELPSMSYSFFETVASATRIASRGSSDAAEAAGTNDRLFDITLIGFKIDAPAGGGGNQGISQGLHTISDGVVT